MRNDRIPAGESEWEDCKVACPACGHEYGDLYEMHDGEEMDCYGCDAVLCWSTEAACTWKVEAFKRSDAEKSERAALEAKAKRDDEKWRRVAEARELKLKQKLDDLGIPMSWAEFIWPDWTPQDLRDSIEKFWSHGGRGPRGWMRSAIQNHAPPLGSHHMVDADTLYEVEGRYVHAWNNMGRLVTTTGDYVVVSCGRGGLYYRARTSEVPQLASRTPSFHNVLFQKEQRR